MDTLLTAICEADGSQIDGLLKAVVGRYGELFPDRELVTLSLCRTSDKNEQLNAIIALLEKMKDR